MSYAERWLGWGDSSNLINLGGEVTGTVGGKARSLLSEADAEIATLRAELEAVKGLLPKAVLAGFKASGEGWNGEYPHEGSSDAQIAAGIDAGGIARTLLAETRLREVVESDDPFGEGK